jgi:hypothetical protein
MSAELDVSAPSRTVDGRQVGAAIDGTALAALTTSAPATAAAHCRTRLIGPP